MKHLDIKKFVTESFELGAEKWFDYADEFYDFVRLIENATLERAALACEEITGDWERSVEMYCAAAIREMKT